MKLIILSLFLIGCTTPSRRGCINKKIAKGSTLVDAERICRARPVDRGWRYDHPRGVRFDR